jgi:hypothetical protein
MKRTLLVLLVTLGIASVASAATVIQTFNDIADVALNNNLPLRDLDVPGGIGFTSGFQQTGSGVAVVRINDLTVSLANYVSGQAGTAQQWSVMAVTNSTGIARRTQTRATTMLSGTIWFSFLASLRNPNGDLALVFEGTWGVNGTPTVNGGGMRVGLGSYNTDSVRGAMGVGPLTSATAELALANIVNGVNGAVTAAGFAPTNDTAGLVLGRIDTDPTTFAPRVSLWYNPDVSNESSLPAPTLVFVDTGYLFVPTMVTRIGYQNVRSTALGVHNEVMDNVKLSDEPNGFDIVYKNAPLPIPILTATGVVLEGNESGPTNLVFRVTADKPVTSPLTVTYTLTGVATNGYDPMGGLVNADYTVPDFDPASFTGTLTIPAGQTSADVVVSVINDTLPEGSESVIFTPQSSFSYILVSGSTLTGYILDNNDANVSLQYMFTRTLLPQVWDTNFIAAPAVVGGIGGGTYSGVYWVSPDAAYSAGGNWTAADAATAVNNGDYMGIVISPAPGRSMTLTNLEFQAIYGNYLFQVSSATGAVVFVRSSLDNYTANLAEFVLEPDNVAFTNPWYSNYVALGNAFSGLTSQVEFRLYIYDDSDHNQVGVRIDNLYFNGITEPLPGGFNQVSLSTNLVNAAEPATAGQFTLVRYGDTTSPLTVNYTVAGTATPGVDYSLLSGSATFAIGESTVIIPVAPLDDDLVEPTETVVVTLTASATYGAIPPLTATVSLLDDGDIGGLVAYFFNEGNNGAGSLAAAAAASIKPTSQVTALNAAAGAGIGTFGTFNNGSLTHGYATSVSRSAPSTLYIGNGTLGVTPQTALQGNDFVRFVLGAKPGHALNLTNFTAWLMMRPDGGQTNWVFLRSSLDDFSSDLGFFAIAGTTNNSPEGFQQWSAPLSIANYPGAIEFRVYVYSSRANNNDIFRMDDVTFQGHTVTAPVGSQVLTVTATDAAAVESGGDTGTFTVARSGDLSAPLTFNYTVGGTAANGVDYALLNGTASFAANQSTVEIVVSPINDNRPELTETVILSLISGAGYFLGVIREATVSLADDGDNTPLFTLITSDNNAYERVPELLGTFRLTRTLGETASTQTINFSLGGSALPGVDYISSVTNALAFEPGVTETNILITPINNALHDGDRTVTLTIQPSAAFLVDLPAESTVTIVDDEVGVETRLWEDDFDSGTSAAKYVIKAGSDLGIDDYVADFAFDYSIIGLPPAPGSATTVGLLLNANSLGAAAGVNLYPEAQAFSGDFALRFNLYVSMDPLAGADNEAAFFGLNQTGLATNWAGAGGTVYTNYGEGVWATMSTRDGSPGIFTLRAMTNAGAPPALVGTTGNFPALFNSPPFAQAGRPNNAYDSANKTWTDCELSQVEGIISLKVNNSLVLQYTNGLPTASGNIFLGYGDMFATLGSANCYAVFDNVRVVRLTAAPRQPEITGIGVNGSTVEIRFKARASDTAGAFKLQSASVVTSVFGDDNTASITALGSGEFKATTTTSNPAGFYRIRRQ